MIRVNQKKEVIHCLEEKLFVNLFLKLFNIKGSEWFSSNLKVFNYKKLDSCQWRKILFENHKNMDNRFSKKDATKRW